jgi:tRNA G18 (ribose-2'-O)-methylase SpoU
MGAVFTLPIFESPRLPETLGYLRKEGLTCIAAHPSVRDRRLSQADLSGDCCIVFGSEGYGISNEVLELCEEAVAIPMPPSVDSLNVGSAAAVFLYEANRQRGKA